MNNDKNDENYIYYVIGQNLKKQRKLKGFTQEKLAEASNYNLSFIGNLESSKVFQTISVGSLYHLSKILGISIKSFFDDIDNDKFIEDDDFNKLYNGNDKELVLVYSADDIGYSYREDLFNMANKYNFKYSVIRLGFGDTIDTNEIVTRKMKNKYKK